MLDGHTMVSRSLIGTAAGHHETRGSEGARSKTVLIRTVASDASRPSGKWFARD